MNDNAPKHDITVQLTGRDGNAFAVLGAVVSAMKRAKLPASDIDAYTKEATAGDYDHLLRVTMRTVTVA